MKKILLKGSVLVLGIVLLTGCDLIKGGNNPETPKNQATEKEVTVNYQDIDNMKKISSLVFEVEKESLKESEFTEDKKSTLARTLVNKNMEDTTGTEMLNVYEKYFGKGKKIEFTDLKCNWDHGSEEVNIIYHFDKDKNKYVYNEKHPGHGGGGKEFIGSEIVLENLRVKDDEYIYEAKVLFYGTAVCGDLGSCQYGKGYKSYEDAKEDKNALLDIDNSNNYWNRNEFPYLLMDKLMSDFRDKLDIYEFHYVKEDDHLIFKSYNKK